MNIPTLLTSIHARIESLSRAKTKYQRTLSPDFNPIEIVGLSENSMSLMIAFLLDQNASHGQGSVFLRAFIDGLKVRWETNILEGVSVRTEAATDRIESSNRRIDILVEGATFILAIENKFWAADQIRQLSDYTDHISKLAGVHKNYCIIYLTPNGSNPSNDSISVNTRELETTNNRFQTLSYTSFIISWLAECRRVAQSPQVWSFLSDLSNFIRNTFVGVASIDQKEIIEAATNSAENVSSALKIAFAVDGIKIELLSRLRTQLDSFLSADALEWNLSQQSKYAGLAIKHPTIAGLKFQIEFQALRCNWLMYGVIIPKEFYSPSIDIMLLRENFTRSLGKNQGSDDWIWCHVATNREDVLPVDTDWSNNERPWNMIVSGELAKLILAARDRLFGLVETSISAMPKNS